MKGVKEQKCINALSALYLELPESIVNSLNEIVIEALDEVRQSELSTKIAEIEREFTDRKVRPLDPVWVKNEIIKRLKGE